MVGCFVPRCRSGYCPKQRSHLFRPSKEVSENWVSIMRRLRSDKAFDPTNDNHRLCSAHFDDSCIIKEDKHKIRGEEIIIPRNKWKLKPDAIPTVFDMLPPSLQPKIKAPRRKLVRGAVGQPLHKRQCLEVAPTEAKLIPDFKSLSVNDVDEWWANNSRKEKWTLDRTQENIYCFIQLCIRNGKPSLSKSILIEFHTQNPTVALHVGDQAVSNEVDKRLVTLEDLEGLFHRIQNLHGCIGLSGFTNISNCNGAVKRDSTWFSTKCQLVGGDVVCKPCKLVHNRLSRLLTTGRAVENSYRQRKFKRQLYYLKSKSAKLSKSTKYLKSEILQLKSYIQKVNIKDVELQLQTLSLPVQTVESIVHSIKSAKIKSKNGLRYSPSWLLECLILRMKSATTYDHIRDSKLLPLPHPRTLRKLIAGQPCEFGINETALSAIKAAVKDKSRRERQGVLIFDEIQLRESVDINPLTKRLDGYIGYGEGNQDLILDCDSDKLANHALVIMYRPLNDSWVQPIAAFATRNAARGKAIHKVVMQVIVKLESLGAEVLSIVCDGAKPNKSFWNLCGVGERDGVIVNKVVHPYDESRHLYFTCDVPHLIKCVRNHFRKYRVVKYLDSEIDFSYYEKLHGEDSTRQYGLRKCPKLTKSHIYPNCFEKMSVPLATQLFSRSVSTGLQFYRELGAHGMSGSESTEIFTKTINDVFDALNTRFPKEGVTVNSKAFQTMERFYWDLLGVDSKTVNRRCSDNFIFASKETLVALKITLKSTLDIIKYLTTELKYAYVLTAKLNQDCLEKFFGLIRAAGGSEEHPTVCNFIQLFRLLSLYNPIKRTIRGSVGVEERLHVLVNFEKQLRSDAKVVKLKNESRKREIDEIIMEKLENISQNGAECDLDEANRKSPVNETIFDRNLVYYLAGYLCFKSRKLIGCGDCVNSIRTDSPDTSASVSRLTDILNYGSLCHPSSSFFLMVMDWEAAICSVLSEHHDYGDIILSSIQKVTLRASYCIGCEVSNHSEVLVKILLPYYATMRLHFYAKSVRRSIGSGKATKNKRKESKLVS